MSEHTSAYVCLLVSEFTSSTFELRANSAVCVCVFVWSRRVPLMSSVAKGKEEPRALKIPHETVSPVCVCVYVSQPLRVRHIAMAKDKQKTRK